MIGQAVSGHLLKNRLQYMSKSNISTFSDNASLLSQVKIYLNIDTLWTGIIVPCTFINFCYFSLLYAPYYRLYVYQIWVQMVKMLQLDKETALIWLQNYKIIAKSSPSMVIPDHMFIIF